MNQFLQSDMKETTNGIDERTREMKEMISEMYERLMKPSEAANTSSESSVSGKNVGWYFILPGNSGSKALRKTLGYIWVHQGTFALMLYILSLNIQDSYCEMKYNSG